MTEKKWKEYLKEELEGKRLLGMVSKDRIVKVKIKRPPQEVAQEFLKLEDVSSTVSDVLDSLGYTKNVIPASILKPINPGQGQKIAGPAITVQNVIDPTSVGLGYEKHLDFKHGADREAYQLGEPGDVVVIDGGGYDISNMGGLSACVAKAKGIAGNIVNGAVRDVELIRKTGYPVWSRGYTPITGKFRYEAISLNAPLGGIYHYACRHFLRRHVRWLKHLDPVEHPWRGCVSCHLFGWPPDGQTGKGGPGFGNCRNRFIHRRHPEQCGLKPLFSHPCGDSP